MAQDGQEIMTRGLVLLIKKKTKSLYDVERLD